MSTKVLTVRQFAAVKRVAQNVNLAFTQREKLEEKIKEFKEKVNALTEEISAHEEGIRKLTGYPSMELVSKVIEDTGKLDKEGKPVKITKYEPKEGRVAFNREKRVYEIQEPVVEGINGANPPEAVVEERFKEEDESLPSYDDMPFGK